MQAAGGGGACGAGQAYAGLYCSFWVRQVTWRRCVVRRNSAQRNVCVDPKRLGREVRE